MYLELNEKLKTRMTQNVGSLLRDVFNKLNKIWRNLFLFSEEETVVIWSHGIATNWALGECPLSQTTFHPFNDLQKSRFKPAQAVLHMFKLFSIWDCLSVASRLLGLVEIVLDAQVILHGGLVLEEPLTELAGHAAHGPVLVPKDRWGGKEFFRCLSLVPNCLDPARSASFQRIRILIFNKM